mmetsp:Transcript_11654/g.17942  ORF Transcript_11654/g.17942 Transcript_11654/m.17942 type:complete len:340 (+) Transcript_11654:29-1048(+)
MLANKWKKEIPTKEEWQAFKKAGKIASGLCSKVKMGDEFNDYAKTSMINQFKSLNILRLQRLRHKFTLYETAFLEKYPQKDDKDETRKVLTKVKQAIQEKLVSPKITNPGIIPSKAQWKIYQVMMQIPERLCDDERYEVDLGDAFQSYNDNTRDWEAQLNALVDLSSKLMKYESNLRLNNKCVAVFDGKSAESWVCDDIEIIKATVTSRYDVYYRLVHPDDYFLQRLTYNKNELDLLDENVKESIYYFHREHYRGMGTLIKSMVLSKHKKISEAAALKVQEAYREDQIIVDETKTGPDRLAAMKYSVEHLISICMEENLYNNGAHVTSIDLDFDPIFDC